MDFLLVRLPSLPTRRSSDLLAALNVETRMVRATILPAHDPRTALTEAAAMVSLAAVATGPSAKRYAAMRSEEHTSELQSHHELVCRPLLEKKNNICIKIYFI